MGDGREVDWARDFPFYNLFRNKKMFFFSGKLGWKLGTVDKTSKFRVASLAFWGGSSGD